MKILKRITTSLSIIVLALSCVALLVFGVSKTGWKALIIPTRSMRPTIPPGSLVLVHSVPTYSLRVGDVITYINPLNPKGTISHRIVKKIRVGGTIPGFITKGDANKSDDIPVVAGSVVGKVVWHLPDLGYIFLAAKTPLIILPAVYLAALLISIEEVKRLSDYYKLGQKYIAPGFKRISQVKDHPLIPRKLSYSAGLISVLLLVGIAFAPSALALFKSNTVTLADNRISSGNIPKQCSGGSSNNTSITINNTSGQSATSGNSKSSGGTASSGSATNNNSTGFNISVTNC